MNEDMLQQWIDEACKMSTLLNNVENLKATMERTKLEKGESWETVETSDLDDMLNRKSVELFDAYAALKKQIRNTLELASDDMQKKYRMWTV